MSKFNNIDPALVHDINSSISALVGAVEVIKEEWKTNPELVERILPLTLDKITQLQTKLHLFQDAQHKLPASQQ